MSSTVTKINAHLSSIRAPDAIRSLPGWLCWRFEQHDGEPKPRKIPFYASGARRRGVQGKPEDRAQLVTFDAARSAAARRGMDGVGLALMPEWGIVALDFDNCVGPGGVLPEIEQLVLGTYAEFSPSGHGVRAFIKGNLGNRKSHEGPFGFETFSTNGFVTFTGLPLDTTVMADSTNAIGSATPEILAMCEARFGSVLPAEPMTGETAPIGLTEQQLLKALTVADPDSGHDEWVRVGMALHHETSGEGFELWDEWSSNSSKYPGREALETRWESFGRGTQRPVTAHALVNMANKAGAEIDVAAVQSAAAFEALPALETDIGNPTSGSAERYAFIQAGAFASTRPPRWIVKGVLPQAQLVVLFGESGSGKSFMALDLAMAIAQGLPWRGHRVKQGKVAYIAAEGAGGFRNRVQAYATAHGVELATLPLVVLSAAPNFLEQKDALDLAMAIKAVGDVKVVFVDTLAQVTPGSNENSAEDMGKALAHCRGIHVATGALVILIHHAGKDASKGARGWSGLKAAADAELEVSRTIAGRALRVSKQKDGEDGQVWGFALEQVVVGEDEDGDPITSCVVREAELTVSHTVAEALAKLGPVSQAVVTVISEIAESQTAGIEIEAVVAEAAKRLPEPENGKRDTRKQKVRRALKALCEGETAPYSIDGDSLEVL